MLQLEKHSLGIGDRFGRQGVAQLHALQKVAAGGVNVTPVWNKSNREHTIIGTEPADTRRAADAAVKEAGWLGAYHLDADHIGLKTVDRFLPYCDFYTIDVADFIGQPPVREEASRLFWSLEKLLGKRISEFEMTAPLDRADLDSFLQRYAAAICEAGRIYQYVKKFRGPGDFIAEVSTDEAEHPQTPLELFLILGALAGEGVRVQTIAPKFTGRFNKGVDYVGDVDKFSFEFEQDLLAIKLAVAEFDQPTNLKMSIHSGSDKFSLYAPVRRLLHKYDAGVHLKTAGTTWLEELIGLAMASESGFDIVKTVYAKAWDRLIELSAPYATVIEIKPAELPSPTALSAWSREDFIAALRHDPTNPRFNPSLRQFLHVSFKIAAEMGTDYLDALDQARDTIAKCVTENLYDRHLRPLFLG